MKIDKKGTITHNLKVCGNCCHQKEKKKSFIFLILILSQFYVRDIKHRIIIPTLFVNLFSSETKFNDENWVNT